MKDKQFIKADLYAVVDVLAMLAIMLFLFSGKREDKTILLWSQVTMILTTLTALAQTLWGQAMVKNNSDEEIYIKPEEATEPVSVPPHSEYYNIDGFKAHGKVYKTSDGVHAKVNKSGKVSITSLTGALIFWIRGGLQTTPKDGGWQKLFDK